MQGFESVLNTLHDATPTELAYLHRESVYIFLESSDTNQALASNRNFIKSDYILYIYIPIGRLSATSLL